MDPLNLPGHFPLALKAEAVGVTRRKVQAQILTELHRVDKLTPCTVPAGTKVRRVHGIWYVADLSWLAGMLNIAPELAGTSIVFHGAKRFGIAINADDVEEIKL